MCVDCVVSKYVEKMVSGVGVNIIQGKHYLLTLRGHDICRRGKMDKIPHPTPLTNVPLILLQKTKTNSS